MGTIKNLGYIKKVAYFPCATPDPVLFLEAAGKAAGIAIMEAATFSCLDIVKMRAGISPWHSRGLRALVRGVNPPALQSEVNGLYKFIIPVEKALFFMFVVDVATGFIANWHSQVFKLGACGNKPLDCTFNGDNPAWICPAGAPPQPITFEKVGGDCPTVQTLGGEWHVKPGQSWQAAMDIIPKPFAGADPPSKCTIEIVELGGLLYKYSPATFEPPWLSNKIKAMYSITATNAHNVSRVYQFRVQTDTTCIAESGNVYITISDDTVFNSGIFPVNCFGKALGGGL